LPATAALATETNAAVPTAPAPASAPSAVAPAAERSSTDSGQRTVTREGYVRKTIDPNAPTDYQLKDIQTGEATEFLLSLDIKFKTYLGGRVTVTGPEMMDPRWPQTPILQVQTISPMP
jgi:hypothetical protein